MNLYNEWGCQNQPPIKFLSKYPKSTYKNEIDIPLFNAKDICFNTYLDYSELAENSSDFILSGSFYVETDGKMDITITDISNRGNVIAAITELKQYFETHRIKI